METYLPFVTAQEGDVLTRCHLITGLPVSSLQNVAIKRTLKGTQGCWTF